MSKALRLPAGLDTTRPAPARIYDYMLQGTNHFDVDAQAAERILRVVPEVRDCAWSNRGFHQRAATWIARQGVKQFLDIGSGLPTVGNTHEVVRKVHRDARVVYVDNDPSVLAHAQALTAGDRTAVIHADLRDPGTILAHPDSQRLIDLTQPLAILFVAVLHFVPDPDAQQAVAAFTSVAAPGSYLVLSHACSEPNPAAAAAGAERYEAGAYTAVPRPRTGILGFLAGFDLVDPGLVPAHRWRPSPDDPPDPGKDWLLGGVARKPAAQDPPAQ